MFNKTSITSLLALCSVLAIAPVKAETPQEILDGYAKQAKEADANFQGFDKARGEQFFKNTHGNDWSCANCHTSNPADPGKHAKTGKSIEPMAPAVNAERFTDSAKVEKWFKRNCNDVVDRACTPLEKGDVMSFLMAIKA